MVIWIVINVQTFICTRHKFCIDTTVEQFFYVDLICIRFSRYRLNRLIVFRVIDTNIVIFYKLFRLWFLLVFLDWMSFFLFLILLVFTIINFITWIKGGYIQTLGFCHTLKKAMQFCKHTFSEIKNKITTSKVTQCWKFIENIKTFYILNWWIYFNIQHHLIIQLIMFLPAKSSKIAILSYRMEI